MHANQVTALLVMTAGLAAGVAACIAPGTGTGGRTQRRAGTPAFTPAATGGDARAAGAGSSGVAAPAGAGSSRGSAPARAAVPAGGGARAAAAASPRVAAPAGAASSRVALAGTAGAAIPAIQASTLPPLPPVVFRAVEPPGGPGPGAGLPGVAARIFAFADPQLHHPYGKRTFAQSPWADRTLSLEVAVRPAALDDGADLILAAFLAERRARYPGHTLVFLGDAADLSCTQELERFFSVLGAAGEPRLLSVASNHDGFYAGNYTQRADAGGGLVLTDMPEDWTRACADPPSRHDHRLTKGRAVRRLAATLPAAPAWATAVVLEPGADAPSAYTGAVLTYARPLAGGDPAAPPVWGIFLDTADYRGFDLTATRGAGTVGAIAAPQLVAMDRAIYEATLASGAQRPTFVAFGHHPSHELEPGSRARLLRFLDQRPQILAYVAAHSHTSNERMLTLPSGRTIPELIVGSTTDAPQAARAIEVRTEPGTGRAAIVSRRVVLDVEASCPTVAPLATDALGYTGYRLVRDDTPDASIGLVDKLSVGLGLSELVEQRITQTVGALLVENDLVRALARLHRDAPGGVTPAQAGALDGLLARRFRAADRLEELIRRRAAAQAAGSLDDYDRWFDRVLVPVVPELARALYSFGAERALFDALRARREAEPARRRYYLCHALHAAAAEARVTRRRAGVTYVP